MKAKQLLGGTGARIAERQYFKQLPTPDEVRAVAALAPGGVRDLVSTKSRRFKELNLAARDLTDDQWVDLLSQEPGLWRRPVAVAGSRLVIGYDAQALSDLVKS